MRLARTIVVGGIIAGVTFPDLALAEAAAGSNCALVSAAMETATAVRGLRARRSVPCRLQNRQQVEQYLRDTIKTKIPRERIKNEGVAYKMLGLIPPAFDYEEGLVDLYTSQLGGYYDADRDYYAMADWMPAAMQYPIAVHELTHALQDQHFRLDNFLDQKKEVSDTLLARSALVEGDATAVMLDYSRKLLGQGPLAKENSVAGVMMQNIAGAMLSSSLTTAPQALQAILVFPYVSGLNFVHAMLREGGYESVNRCFAKLPASTEEILHPKKYFAGLVDYTEIPHVDISALAGRPVGEPVFSDRMGEFVTSTLLGSLVSPSLASEAAAGWGGDQLELYEVEGGAHLLYWDTRWDSARDTEEFFNALSKAFQARFGESSKSGAEISFKNTRFGRVFIRQGDRSVTLLMQP